MELFPVEIIPLALFFSTAFFFLRILKLGIKASFILATILTFAVPLAIPDAFDKIHQIVLGFGVAWISIVSVFLFIIGLAIGKGRKKERKLSDIEILGKLEFKKAELAGKLSLAKAKKEKRVEERVKKEIEKVEKEIAALKRKLGRYI